MFAEEGKWPGLVKMEDVRVVGFMQLQQQVIRFEGFEVDRSRWVLTWNHQSVSVSPKGYDLLLYLIDHRDRVVGKDELMNALWPNQFVEESNLTQHVFLLRKAFARHTSGKLIETVPGRGYRFNAQVETPEPATQEVLIDTRESVARFTYEEELHHQTDSGEAASLPSPTPRFRTPVVAACACAVLLLAAAGYLIRQRLEGP